MNLYQMMPEHQSRWASFENPLAQKGAGGTTNQGGKGSAYDIIYAGEVKELLNVPEGSGIIHRFWMTLDHVSPQALRTLRLDMYWDGAELPAVSVPLGDFFLYPFGRMSTHENELFANPEGRSFNCYIPMPFRDGARITLTNEGETQMHRVFYDINFSLVPELDPDSLYFHAHWRRERPTELAKDFTILPKITGSGRFLGASVGVAGTPGLRGWWGEGETKIFLDGDEELATLVGTGTEDYIGTAWGQGRFAGRYQGCLLMDESLALYSFYRFHVPDPVYFHEDCRVTIQQMGGVSKDQIFWMQEQGIPVKPVSVIQGEDGKIYNLLDGTAPSDLNDPLYGETSWTNYYRCDDVCSVAYYYLDAPVSVLSATVPLNTRLAPRYVMTPPAKTVVLTFDDAVRSHLNFVAPLLKENGFGATFFVTNQWREDQENFLSWEEIAKLHQMGFEIGNHTWNHDSYNTPENARKLAEELEQVNQALETVGVPRPSSFAWPGNAFGPEALDVLREKGIALARRGMQPEIPYGERKVGPAYRTDQHHPLLIPTTGDAYPEWDLEHFKAVLEEAQEGQVVVLQFHGVPDQAHPWVDTNPEEFKKFVAFLKDNGYSVMALRDVSMFVDPEMVRRPVSPEQRFPESE